MKKKVLILVLALVAVAVLCFVFLRTGQPVSQPMPDGVVTMRETTWNFYDSGSGNGIVVTVPEEWAAAPYCIYTSYTAEEVAPEDNLLYDSYAHAGTLAVSGWSQRVTWDPGRRQTALSRKDQGLPEEQWYLDTDDAFLTVQFMDGTDIIGYAVLRQVCQDATVNRKQDDGTTRAVVLPVEYRVEVLEAVWFPKTDGRSQSVTQEYVDRQMTAVMSAARKQSAA